MQRTDTVPATYLPALLQASLDASGRVYEDYSQYDQHLRSFSDRAGLLEYIASKQAEEARHVGLAVHFPDTKGYVRTKTIQLIPEKCGGATWRESIEGWGLVQVQFTFLGDGLVQCRIAVNSEERASGWSSTAPDLRDPSLWDWKRVEVHAKRLIRVLRKGAYSPG